jgi:CheY-like chemotaxis protein
VEIARPKWQAESPTRTGPIDVHVDAPGRVMAMGDSSELREVVLNLIFNAVDAMTRGGIIEIGTCVEGSSAKFWVADNGSGMKPDVVARIFEPFYSTKGERGTGLGLSASHGIIENHGGDINVTSEVGKGTRFEVVLPLHQASSSIVPEAKTETVEAKSARILVVEDEEEVRVLLNDAFRTGGHDVTEATTGAEALKRLDAKEFDLMVCDLGLPELSGLHVARWVKEFRPDMPVIIATGFAEMIAQDDYNKARIDEVISKPYAVADVLVRANVILARQASKPRETVLV